MDSTHGTGTRVVTMIIALIGVISAVIGLLIVLSYIPKVVEEELMWTISIISTTITIGLSSKKESS